MSYKFCDGIGRSVNTLAMCCAELSTYCVAMFISREHAMLAKTAGVKHMVILINKMDDPTVSWDEERYGPKCSVHTVW